MTMSEAMLVSLVLEAADWFISHSKKSSANTCRTLENASATKSRRLEGRSMRASL
jgi:hypothetical protein